MKEFKNIIIPDDVYYLVLSHIEKHTDYKKKVYDMSKEEFLEAYDKAVAYNRSQILSMDEYFKTL